MHMDDGLKTSNKNPSPSSQQKQKFPQGEEQLSSYIQDRCQHSLVVSMGMALLKITHKKEFQKPNEDFSKHYEDGHSVSKMDRNNPHFPQWTGKCTHLFAIYWMLMRKNYWPFKDSQLNY